MPPFHLPPEIQYWAGVIMRNACRKDDSRGGIRQCANMICGKWERYPREFAKCRRCRKARYCGKECQSKAWSDGHRFWCSVREGAAPGSGNNATERGAADETASVATARPRRTPQTRPGVAGLAVQRQAAPPPPPPAPMDTEEAPTGLGTAVPLMFTTPTIGTHTVTFRVRSDGTVVQRGREPTAAANQLQGTQTQPPIRHRLDDGTMVPQPPPEHSTIIIGAVPTANDDMELDFSPDIPSNDIFSRDVDPDFVPLIPRRRTTQRTNPTPSTSRAPQPSRGIGSSRSSRSTSEDVEMSG